MLDRAKAHIGPAPTPSEALRAALREAELPSTTSGAREALAAYVPATHAGRRASDAAWALPEELAA